ncbi:aldo/keto reductase [uncultured Paludibaculum sp.]|uniref:aldo/keto reductase n=1 Tax=uncultured Paludibaculum sp. TaxID=1765020 RepID=UPI002AAB73C5|nr:aldo/keto reductase [uncultured Paludibaculum sp.]
MKRRIFVGGAFSGMSITGALAAPQKVKAGDIPTTTFGKTGVKVSVIAQGGARMDLLPDIPTAAAHVRKVYDLGISYFDCSRLYWDGRAEEAYGIGLEGVRKNVFLTTKTVKRSAKEAMEELETSFRLLKTDYVDLWQAHAVQNRDDIDKLLAPGGAIEAFEAAKKAGKCRFIGFTGHYDPEAHAALMKAYDRWDTVMMPIHAADHAYLSFEKTALPEAIERGLGTQAIKVFGKAFLLRSLSPTECLRYVLSQPGVHVAVCGAGTQGQMEDNIRAVQNFKKMTPEETADVRRRAIVGSGVYTGPTMEYWKKKT